MNSLAILKPLFPGAQFDEDRDIRLRIESLREFTKALRNLLFGGTLFA